MSCAKCEGFPSPSTNFDELGIHVERHGTLYRCQACGQMLELIAEERLVRFISTEQAKKDYPIVWTDDA